MICPDQMEMPLHSNEMVPPEPKQTQSSTNAASNTMGLNEVPQQPEPPDHSGNVENRGMPLEKLKNKREFFQAALSVSTI
jgi:hypothetical protein